MSSSSSHSFDDDTLAAAHPVPEFDSRLAFDEAAHVYTDRTTGHCFDISVSGVVKQFFPSFDSDAIIQRLIQTPSQSRYRGMDAATIKAEWAETAEHGRRLHAIIERLLKTRRWQAPDCGLAWAAGLAPAYKIELAQFTAFYATHIIRQRGLVPFRVELRLADTASQVAGTLDALFVSPADGHLELYDWKRVHRIDAGSRFANALPVDGPLAGLAACNLVYYGLQLNLYKRILERNAPSLAPITHMWLAVFHPDQAVAKIIEVPTMTSAADWMLETTAARRQSTPKVATTLL